MDTSLERMLIEIEKIDGFDEPGREPYKLLAWLSMSVNKSIIFDVGTLGGASAKALAYNKTNRIISYDITDTRPAKVENAVYKIGDFRKDPLILKSPLISIDVAPHDGIQELEFHKFFLENNYKGVVVWDDIIAFPGMRPFWNDITQTKYDLTPIGHHSGTGLVIYGY